VTPFTEKIEELDPSARCDTPLELSPSVFAVDQSHLERLSDESAGALRSGGIVMPVQASQNSPLPSSQTCNPRPFAWPPPQF
jgi:hypothetical protein